MFDQNKKIAKAEAKHNAKIEGYRKQEGFIRDRFNNPNAKYYHLYNISVNFHDEGIQNGFRDMNSEDYIIFPSEMTKNMQRQIESELRQVIIEKGLTFYELIDYVILSGNENYRAYLFWNAPTFKSFAKKNGKDEKAMGIIDRWDAVDDIEKIAKRYDILYARDLVQLVAYECPPAYRYVLFERAKEITGRFEDEYKKNKFKKAKKGCL